MVPAMSKTSIEHAHAVVASLRDQAIALADEHAATLAKVHEDHRLSAINLLHYLALRRHDLRPLQQGLAELGLSSLGRCEAHVLDTLDAVLKALAALRAGPAPDRSSGVLGYGAGRELLKRNTERLLGPAPRARDVRILVTAPPELADSGALAETLVKNGMDALRVNCAHDDERAWAAMVAHARAAAKGLTVLMDLPGPKLRIGLRPAGPKVRKIRPRRDAVGELLAPARVLLGGPSHGGLGAGSAPGGERGSASRVDAALPVDDSWVARLVEGSVVEFHDARGKHRSMRVVATGAGWAIATLAKTAYVTTGTRLSTLQHHWGGDGTLHLDTCPVGELPATETPLSVRPGDELTLTNDLPAEGNALPCTLPEVFGQVRPGDRVLFDDGKVAGTVLRGSAAGFVARIDRTPPDGGKLTSDKGINLPDTRLRLPALTAEDRALLPFVAKHADVIALSFLEDPSGVVELLDALAATQSASELGIVLKIETKRAFEQLPFVLLEALRHRRVGVMIARGDLAVECGFERLAEVQEEILWLCEAAHVPVIWATQVLEGLAKTGMPSRAEITDAAMSERAECVMLNKGPCLVAALRMLDDILRRMQAHQSKKSQTLRPLSISGLVRG
jgi:pyruvate kinase